MIRNLCPINRENLLPVIEFAKDLEHGAISAGCYTDGKSKLLVLSRLKEKASVGEIKENFERDELIGLLFYKNESIDSLIKSLKKLKKMGG